MDDFRIAEAHLGLGVDTEAKQGVVDAAVTLLLRGHDTPSLRVLAGEDNAAEHEVESYLIKRFASSNLTPLSIPNCVLELANRDASALLKGEMQAEDAAQRLWDLFVRFVAGSDDEYPAQFVALGYAALMVTEPEGQLWEADLAAAASDFVTWRSSRSKAVRAR